MAKRGRKVADKVVGQVYETTDLNQFKLIDGNREIKVTSGLRASIRLKGVQIPIKIKKNMEVVDGQHRLAVAKELGIPIKYIFDDNDNVDIADLNSTSKAWRLTDYIHKYAVDGLANYRQLERMLDSYSILKPMITVTNASGTAGVGTHAVVAKDIKSGNFAFKNYKEYEKFVISYVKFVEATGFRTNQQVQGTYFIMYTLKAFNESRFIKKVNSRGLSEKLAGVTSTSRIMKQFIETNNSGLSPKSKNFVSSIIDGQDNLSLTGKFNTKLIEELPVISMKN